MFCNIQICSKDATDYKALVSFRMGDGPQDTQPCDLGVGFSTLPLHLCGRESLEFELNTNGQYLINRAYIRKPCQQVLQLILTGSHLFWLSCTLVGVVASSSLHHPLPSCEMAGVDVQPNWLAPLGALICASVCCGLS